MQYPHWLMVAGAVLVVVGFIGFAFRQGMKVKPDKDNPDNWQSSGGGDASHHGFDGHG